MKAIYLIILIILAIVLGLVLALTLGVKKNTYNIDLPSQQPATNQ